MSFFLADPPDFDAHNEQVSQLWDAYHRREQSRVPMSISGSIRGLISNPAINDTGYSFRDFFESVDAQIACQLAWQDYRGHHILCDSPMGLPSAWNLSVDFQNSYDQAWFGCAFRYFDDTDVPDTDEIFKDDPDAIFDVDDPDPFWGRGDFMKRAMEMFEQMHARCAAGLEYRGREVNPPAGPPCVSSDGTLSIACKLRGTVEVMTDMIVAPERYHALMDYVCRNQIARCKALRQWQWERNNTPQADRHETGAFWYADDAIAMLSCEQYQQFVLPYHRRMYDTFWDGKTAGGMHLCGDATHHFKFLSETFNVQSFDTGFPVDHGWLRKQLGPDVTINGGPTVMCFKEATPEQVADQTRRVCESGVMDGRRFILIAANNLAPCTPVENIAAAYEAVKEYGRYE